MKNTFSSFCFSHRLGSNEIARKFSFSCLRRTLWGPASRWRLRAKEESVEAENIIKEELNMCSVCLRWIFHFHSLSRLVSSAAAVQSLIYHNENVSRCVFLHKKDEKSVLAARNSTWKSHNIWIAARRELTNNYKISHILNVLWVEIFSRTKSHREKCKWRKIFQ